ncbi:MAG: hypothetical protein R3C18_06185 [Planctomycetaceae bacterium]
MIRYLLPIHYRLVDFVVTNLGTTSTPYTTDHCTRKGELLPAEDFDELAAVPEWRQLIPRRQADPKHFMQHQPNRRSCIDRVLESLVCWCRSRWSESIRPLPPGDTAAPDKWREQLGIQGTGYVNWQLFARYFNSLGSEHRGGFTLRTQVNQRWPALHAKLDDHQRPVMVSYMLSPIPWVGRVLGRLVLFVTHPIDKVVCWVTMAFGGAGFSLHRERFLQGDDDIHLYYPHSGLVLGLFQEKTTSKEFVLIAEPWGGDFLSFSGRSKIFEVLEREEFERRWHKWEDLKMSPTIRSRWYLLASPGTMFVLEEEAEAVTAGPESE